MPLHRLHADFRCGREGSAMSPFAPNYELRSPNNLREALDMLADAAGDPRPFAGGTDLMVLLESGDLPEGTYVSLWGLEELSGIRVAPDAVELGALTTYTEVLEDPTIGAEFPLLCAAARETGGVATQNRGTLGGNIANASPAADSPPAFLVYDAELELISAAGTRRVPYDRFHTGYKQMDMRRGEIIKSIRLRRGRGAWRQTFRKVGPRRAQAISKISFAAAADMDGVVVRDLRIALGSVAPTVVRCVHAEAAVRGLRLDRGGLDAARLAISRDISPIDDMRSTADYRMRVAQNLLIQFLSELTS
jgi:CO/xanthine dehydrogenase FAD-binding subunit